MLERMGHLASGRTPATSRSISRIVPVCCLLLVLAVPAGAQTVVPRDTTRRPPGDTARAAGDSASGRAGDSLRTTAGDTTRPAHPDPAGGADTPRRSTAESTREAAPSAAAASPGAGDSVLAAACAQGGSLAANLLVVLFTPVASDSDRTALAKAVGGTLAGPADAVRAGGVYLRVPNGDLDPTVADRVIRYPSVAEVGPASCRSP
jgi:hypothetical protein